MAKHDGARERLMDAVEWSNAAVAGAKPRVFFYKLVVDGGGAPCVYRRVLSLAICKPQIRKSARVGDWVFGFGAAGLDLRLIYIAEVSEKIRDGDYYRGSRHATRPDCIYRWSHGRFRLRAGARFHTNKDIKRDLGVPPAYLKAQVLVSRNFVYFGSATPPDYAKAYPVLGAAVQALGQGHRINHNPAIRTALLALRDEVFRRYRSNTRLGRPIHASGESCDPADAGSCRT